MTLILEQNRHSVLQSYFDYAFVARTCKGRKHQASTVGISGRIKPDILLINPEPDPISPAPLATLITIRARRETECNTFLAKLKTCANFYVF